MHNKSRSSEEVSKAKRTIKKQVDHLPPIEQDAELGRPRRKKKMAVDLVEKSGELETTAKKEGKRKKMASRPSSSTEKQIFLAVPTLPTAAAGSTIGELPLLKAKRNKTDQLKSKSTSDVLFASMMVIL